MADEKKVIFVSRLLQNAPGRVMLKNSDNADKRTPVIKSAAAPIKDRRLATAWIHCDGSATYEVTEP